MAGKLVPRDLADGVLTLTLDRPDRLDAFTRPLAGDLVGALSRADQDDAVRAVIVAGARRGFCAGADLAREIADNGEASGPLRRSRQQRPARRLSLVEGSTLLLGRRSAGSADRA